MPSREKRHATSPLSSALGVTLGLERPGPIFLRRRCGDRVELLQKVAVTDDRMTILINLRLQRPIQHRAEVADLLGIKGNVSQLDYITLSRRRAA